MLKPIELEERLRKASEYDTYNAFSRSGSLTQNSRYFVIPYLGNGNYGGTFSDPGWQKGVNVSTEMLEYITSRYIPDWEERKQKIEDKKLALIIADKKTKTYCIFTKDFLLFRGSYDSEEKQEKKGA